MNPKDAQDGTVDRSELLARLEALEDGTLGPEQVDALMARLEQSRAARQIYLDYFADSAALRHIARVLDEQGKIPLVETRLASRKVLRLSVMAAAALVLLSGAIATFIRIHSPGPPDFVIDATEGSQWSLSGEGRDADPDHAAITPGTTVTVLSGTLRLEQRSGCVFLVQGPAEVGFPEPGRPVLRHGWLWVDTNQSGAKLEVWTPDFQVRNLGTRFGVRVPVDGPVEVHLIEGKVELTERRQGRVLASLDQVGFACSVGKDGEIAEIPLGADPFPRLPELLARSAGYRAITLGQSPSGYWALDEASGMTASNQVHGSSEGRFGKAVRPGDPGVGPGSGLAGFPAANRSPFLSGLPDQSVLLGIDGLHGVQQREGAVSFWVRQLRNNPGKDKVLWLAGKAPDTGEVPIEAVLHSRVTRSGRVIFEIKEGTGSVELSTKRGLADGKWHHLVASWSPTVVELFLDGRLEARREVAGGLGGEHLEGRYVRFGKPSLDLYDTYDAYTGWVDEIALWNRPLTAIEVAAQYEAARNPGIGASGGPPAPTAPGSR